MFNNWELIDHRPVREAARSDFAWFDLTKYEAICDFTLTDWFEAIFARKDALMAVPAARGMASSSQEVLNLLGNPLALHRPRAAMQLTCEETLEGPPIGDVCVLDLIYGLGSPGKQFFKELEALVCWENGGAIGEHPDLPLLISPLRSGASTEYGSPVLPIWVDLGADDQLLEARFKEWLANARKEFGSSVRPLKWSDSKRQDWINYRVLQYIDLQIYCARIADAKLKQALAGDLLFPDDPDVDATERIRKVVAPLAEMLLSEKFLAVLSRRIAEAERN